MSTTLNRGLKRSTLLTRNPSQRMSVIASDPGAGKSTTVQQLLDDLQRGIITSDFRWVIPITFSDLRTKDMQLPLVQLLWKILQKTWSNESWQPWKRFI